MKKKVDFERWLAKQNLSEEEKEAFRVFSGLKGWAKIKKIEESFYWFCREEHYPAEHLLLLK